MSRIKKVLLVILIVFIGIQLIQPARNESGQELSTDISKTVSIPSNVGALLKTACYDCHSNNTNYPWYAKIQPGEWWLASHIKNGKKELNFSEFGAYSSRRQQSKLKSIASQVEDGKMPLASYEFLHKNARLTNEQKGLIIHWALQTKDKLENQ
ncbi:heme-binding domain-containing protein [Pedobacter immunditicola]|uniref:heme-binding domain-containing protein n=1 Tax=Pedobacter immunditicola TaxID=3133440 RepID=UPI00309A1618